MNTEHDRWNRLRGMGRLVAIGCMILTAGLAAGAEELSAWGKRMPIAFSGYGGTETLTNFPVLVVLSNTTAGVGFDYNDFQSPPYEDLRFALSNKETPLDYEVELWDTNGMSYVWVRVPEVTVDTTIYAMWGRVDVALPPCATNGAVWAALYKGVWHLGDQAEVITNLFCDATANRSHGTGMVSASGRDGVVGIGQAFDGTDDRIAVPSFVSSVQNEFTWTFWLNPTASHGIDAQGNSGTGGTSGQKYALGAVNYGTTAAGMGVSAGINGISVYEHASGYMPAVAVWQGSVTNWHHVAVVYTARRPAIYVDGVLVRTGVLSAKTIVYPSNLIGGGDYGYFSGLLDEVRLADAPLSADRVLAEYMNMASNDAFAAYGDPESQDLPAVGVSGWATNVTTSSAWLNGTLSSTGTSDTAVFVYWGTDDGGTNASAWANTNIWAASQMPGVFTVQATDLSADSTYYYQFAASNAAGWAWTPQASVFITGEVWIDKLSDASEVGPTPGTFTVHRAAAATNEALTVTYMVAGTATPGVDYRALSGTITIPKGEDNATIEVMPFFDHFVEGTETVEVALVPGPYALGSSSNATVEIEDYGLVTRTWSGEGADKLASTAANWAEGAVPEAGDRIVLTNENAGALTWDLNIPLHSWLQDGYTNTVTVLTVYPEHGTFTNFVILNDCEIQSGFLTHSQNSNAQKYRLALTVGGKLTIGAEGSVHADARGFKGGNGPGRAEGASYGGSGAGLSINTGYCYGSITDPLDLGSGGGNNTSGGGALLLRVAGEMRNDGNCSSDGQAITSGSASGGSVWVFASSLTGSGRFSAKGGDGTIYRVAGGGRMAFILTDLAADFSAFTGTMTAYSGAGHGFAGTVYRETVTNGTGHGELIVDNLNGYTDSQTPYVGVFVYGRLATELNYYKAVSYAFSRIVLTNKAVLFVGSDDTLDLRETELVGGGRSTTGIRVGGGTILTPPVFTWSNLFFCVTEPNAVFSGDCAWVIASNAELRIDQPLALTNGNSLVVQRGGLVTHTANGGARSYALNLTLDGALTVEAGGSVDVSGRGYAANSGPGCHPFVTSGSSYGGVGSGLMPCYGSWVHPEDLGSGGRSGGAGGGAIRLTVFSALTNNGTLAANAASSGSQAGAGGSVWLTTSSLVGSGDISADSAPNMTGSLPGGGGRVAIHLTESNADLSAYTGIVRVRGGRMMTGATVRETGHGGAGTIYLQHASEAESAGTLIVDNAGLAATYGTLISTAVIERATGTVEIRNGARLALEPDVTLQVGGDWSNAVGRAGFSGSPGSVVELAGPSGSVSVVWGSTDFERLICTNGGRTLRFEAGQTNRISDTGRLVLAGDAAHGNLTLRSTEDGVFWNLCLAADTIQSVNNVDVQDSDADSGGTVYAMNSVGFGQNNTNWFFNNVISGETITWIGGTNPLWQAAENWDLPRAPVASDRVVIPASPSAGIIFPRLTAETTVASLLIASGASLELNGTDLTVTGKLDMAGTLIAAGMERLTIKGNADFTGGTVVPACSTLAIAGSAAQTVNPADCVFGNVTIENAAPVLLDGGLTAMEFRCEAPSDVERSVVFAAGSAVIVRDWVVRGALGRTNVFLSSGTPGSTWYLNATGSRRVWGVKVSDSDASGGEPVPAPASEDGGRNVNWYFSDSGRVKQWTAEAGGLFHTAANWTPVGVPATNALLIVESGGLLTVTGDVQVLDLTVGGGEAAASVRVSGNVTVTRNVTVADGGTLEWNAPGTVGGNLIVTAGGLLTHRANGATELYKLDLMVAGDVDIDVGGAVNTTGKGHSGGQGPGGAEGASHGGINMQDYLPCCYGSILAPINIGSGGRDGSVGGGAIRITATGRLRNNGTIRSDGTSVPVGGGSGGSIYLTAGTLAGSGVYTANGGGGASSRVAGGGRMAFVVTHSGANLDALDLTELHVQGGSYPSSPTSSGGSGTIYLQSGLDKPGRGTVRVANFDRTGFPVTEVPSLKLAVLGEADRADFRVRDGAWLRLAGNFTVGDIWLETGNARLYLGGHTLTVKAREHPLTPGTVVTGGTVENPGKIIWTGLPPGVLIIVK